MYYILSGILRVVDYIWVPRNFLWTAISIGTELTVINLITSKDNEESFYNLKVLLAKRADKNFTQHKEIERHRMDLFLFAYVLITKILALLNWNIWEIIFIPLFALSSPLMINYCLEILKDWMEEKSHVDDSHFSMKINISSEQANFPNFSIRNIIGIASLLLFPLASYLITKNTDSDYYGIMIMMIGIVHFTPFFLRKPGKKTKMDWIAIIVSLNLGIIGNISIFGTIISNILLYIYITQLKKNIKYFKTIQYFLMAASINTILIFKEVGTPKTIEIFCETHTLALLFYVVLTIFLTFTLLTPPQIFIKKIELSKTLIPLIGACYLLINLMLIEESNTAPGFLRDTYQSFHQNMKIFNSLIILIVLEFIILVKLINYCDHRFEDIPCYLDVPESSYVELSLLALKNYTVEEIIHENNKFFKDRYYTSVLLKFADITIIFAAIVINNSILDSFYYFFGSPFLKAAVLHFKSRSFIPVATSLINLPSTAGPSNFIEEDDPNWNINWLVFILVVIPLNILSIYIDKLKNYKSKKAQKRSWEFVVVKF